MRVELTPAEMMQAAVAGAQRQIENLSRFRQDRHGAPSDKGWEIHIQGAAGEMAVAKWRGLYWAGKGVLRAGDVGLIQVRTRSRHDYELILHDDDPDDSPFVLVTGLAPAFWLRGWVFGHEGKRPEYWSDPAGGRAAFFVPVSALRPMPGPSAQEAAA